MASGKTFSDSNASVGYDRGAWRIPNVSLIAAHQEPGKQDNQQDNQHNIGTFSSAATRRLVGLANVPRYFLAMDSAVTAFIARS